ncbi:Leucine Rich Repeat [Seminavis robusta]|uniref:Leucine Rich Repeat n=1 Tax=Seminavis robusta TaxID=568900 RepID=A0A9N8HKD3_9STRA|nr:Leucine Rich Repeat [Seminavis robusta]|eukprot:Sro722_g192900.1 Leucine Rich Repeat (437) ;mRNA; r:28643-30085
MSCSQLQKATIIRTPAPQAQAPGPQHAFPQDGRLQHCNGFLTLGKCPCPHHWITVVPGSENTRRSTASTKRKGAHNLGRVKSLDAPDTSPAADGSVSAEDDTHPSTSSECDSKVKDSGCSGAITPGSIIIDIEDANEDSPSQGSTVAVKPIEPNRQESLPGAWAQCPSNDGSRDGTSTQDDEDTPCFDDDNTAASQPRSDAQLRDSNLVTAISVDEDEESHFPTADPVQPPPEDKEIGTESQQKCFFCLLFVILVVATTATLLAVAKKDEGNDTASTNDSALYDTDTGEQISPADYVSRFLPSDTLQRIEMDPFSPQALAFDWLIQDPFLFGGNYSSDSSWRLPQRLALATLYFSLGGEGWPIQDNWLSYDHDECTWDFPGSFYFDVPELTFALATKTPCDDTGRYINPRLISRNKVEGQIPEELDLPRVSGRFIQ